MTSRFYDVSDNTFDTRGFPWISHINSGLKNRLPCPECDAFNYELPGELAVSLEPKKGTKWPDVIGCGAEPLFIVSKRVLRDWKNDGIGEFLSHRIHIIPPFPKRLQDMEPPYYSWLDGSQMHGARMDFDASGFVEVTFCLACGRRSDNVTATYDRQHSKAWPMAFIDNSWTGENLFTTDLSPAAFFCTESVVESARKHGHTNFRFVSTCPENDSNK